MSDKKRSFRGAIAAGVVSLILLAASAWLFMNRQYAMDQVSVWSFTPSSSIKTIGERVDFTNKGTFYFYATHPEVAGDDRFNQDCPRQEVGSPILGCYTSGRIFVYDINNPELDGIEEVTAAHEMLHAAWERMDSKEQTRIGALLRAEYQKHLDNKDLVTRMEYYERTEPGQFENELHSILPTEVKSLSPELETYFKQYFNDRQKIITLHTKYDSVFKNLKSQSETLFNELTSLGASIETRTAQFNTDVTSLSSDIATFNQRADNGEFTSISQFNAERSTLIARSDQLESDRLSISSDINTYNSKYVEYQKVAERIEVLNKSIDSIKDLQPTPSI